ncbi:hypothetical protein ACOMHN_065429 [Nucella lapillus]
MQRIASNCTSGQAVSKADKTDTRRQFGRQKRRHVARDDFLCTTRSASSSRSSLIDRTVIYVYDTLTCRLAVHPDPGSRLCRSMVEKRYSSRLNVTTKSHPALDVPRQQVVTSPDLCSRHVNSPNPWPLRVCKGRGLAAIAAHTLAESAARCANPLKPFSDKTAPRFRLQQG